MREAGRITGKALELAESLARPGVTTGEIDAAVEALIRREGGIPAFLDYPSPTPGVRPFPASICASVNEEVVHGIPGPRVLKAGDIIAIDVGVCKDGYFGDAARTYAIGEVSRKAQKLLETTAKCLELARNAFRPGQELRKISQAIQIEAEGNGFSVVRQFVGHGIGRNMHEPPQVTNFDSKDPAGRTLLKPGLVICPEPMLNAGKSEVRVAADGWTVLTKDRSLSAHFEDTLALTEQGVEVLTRAG